MKARWVCLLYKHTASPRHGSASGRALLLALAVWVTGCVDTTHSRIPLRDVEGISLKDQVTDYRLAECDNLWQIDDRDAMNNALYWLRAMDCAERLTPRQAREEAQGLTGINWETSFKQSILLDQARLTPAERRQALDRLTHNQQDFPAALRPLLQNWRDRQVFWLALTEERLRSQRTQEVSDKQVDALRTQIVNLQYQLDVTTRKLENLTDIERQLSSRKQMSGELPESSAHDADALEHHVTPQGK